MSIREKIIDYSRGNDLSRFWRLYRRQQRAKSGFRRDVLTFLMSRCAARHGGYIGPDAVIRGVPSLPHGLHGVFISRYAVIGANCRIYQNVTIGEIAGKAPEIGDGCLIGAGAVLMPFGGRRQLTPVQAMVQKIPMEQGNTDSCSFLSWGYNPFITSAMKGLTEAVNTALSDIEAGDWSEIAASNGNFGLEDGDYIGLPTADDSWNFETFTKDEYETVKDKIKSGEITVDNNSDDATKPTVSEFTTVNDIQ